MIWKLALYQDPATGNPTSYTLDGVYGMSQPGSMGVAGGGTAITLAGGWVIVQGTSTNPNAVIYQLNSTEAQPAVFFLALNEDLLHVLERDQTLKVGNAAWSYTLNRTDNRSPSQIGEPPGSTLPTPTRPPIPPTPPGASVLGVFEGRTPCHEIVLAFTRTAPHSGCAKAKWRVALYLDQATGAPSTYLSVGTSAIREGTWTITRGMAGDPDAIVYRLHADGPQPPVSFLRVDDKHLFLLDKALDFLVGDALFSYTLSRRDPAMSSGDVPAATPPAVGGPAFATRAMALRTHGRLEEPADKPMDGQLDVAAGRRGV